jgi:acetyl esterase
MVASGSGDFGGVMFEAPSGHLRRAEDPLPEGVALILRGVAADEREFAAGPRFRGAGTADLRESGRMPVDPDIRRALEVREELGGEPLSAGTPQQARRAFREVTLELRDPAQLPAVADLRETTVPGPEGPLAARVYRPEGAGDAPLPTLVFFHGGGWLFGDLDTHELQARSLCREVGAVVLSVAYRLAPEDPFPAAVQDALAATRWAAEHVGELGADPDRLAVAGDSAGGNLATVVARLARDDGPPLAAQLLIYPVTETHGEHGSRVEFAEGYYLTRQDMEWFERHYEGVANPADPDISPLRAADLSGLAPAFVVTAEYDPLRDEGEAYASALQAAGVPVVRRRFDGMIHGFFGFALTSPAAAQAVRDMCTELRALLTPARAAV